MSFRRQRAAQAARASLYQALQWPLKPLRVTRYYLVTKPYETRLPTTPPALCLRLRPGGRAVGCRSGS
jgi:hypothetical protein